MTSFRVRVSETAIWNIWICDECGTLAELNPDWYEQNGTPICSECGDDMHYDCTELQWSGEGSLQKEHGR